MVGLRPERRMTIDGPLVQRQLGCYTRLFRREGTMFLRWLLKYSSFFITGIVTFVVTWLVDRFITRRAALIFYTSHQQYVTLIPAQGQPPMQPIGTFTLFLWN